MKSKREDGNGLPDAYTPIYADISKVIEDARRSVARSANSIMTAAYWLIGRRIVEHEQSGKERAAYGERLLIRLAADLTTRYGRGFGVDNLQRFRNFYLAYPPAVIYATLSRKYESSDSVGLILCARKDEAVAHYALDGLSNKVMAAEYRTALPKEDELAAEITRVQTILQHKGRLASSESGSNRGKRGKPS